MMPKDTNMMNVVHGGVLFTLAGNAAYAAASSHAGYDCMAKAIDRFTLQRPVLTGDLVTFRATVNYVGRSSMEVGVRVSRKNTKTGETGHVTSIYFMMVAIDETGESVPVPPLIMETEDELRRAKEAEERWER
jgi:acyl-CoA hydrolase